MPREIIRCTMSEKYPFPGIWGTANGIRVRWTEKISPNPLGGGLCKARLILLSPNLRELRAIHTRVSSVESRHCAVRHNERVIRRRRRGILSCINVCKHVTCVFYVQYLAGCNSWNGCYINGSTNIIHMNYLAFYFVDFIENVFIST